MGISKLFYELVISNELWECSLHQKTSLKTLR